MEKRGLTDGLKASALSAEAGLFWADEMRVGLIGQTRRVWASVGVKVIQPREYTYKWAYLNLAVNGLTGQLLWQWGANMKAATIAPIVAEWASQGVSTVVWDGARGHQGDAYAELPVQRLTQPPYSPELNPAERVFAFLRDRIEGLLYGSIENKQQAVERELQALAANPLAVKRLAGWDWIRAAVSAALST